MLLAPRVADDDDERYYVKKNNSDAEGFLAGHDANERITLESDTKSETEEFDETSLHMRQLLKTKLVDMDLSVRALNCLKAADVETLGDLVSYAKADLLKFRNFGKKSLTELEDLVDNKGLTFGMNVSKYKLDKE